MIIPDSGQLEKAKLEDALVSLLFRKYPNLVFHGGTCIWRCYNGNRFSRDLDFYYKIGAGKSVEEFYKQFCKFLDASGFKIKGKKYNNKINTMHILVETNVKMKMDINFDYKKGRCTDYLNVDDSKTAVLALTPEEILIEKIGVYNSRLAKNADPRIQPQMQDLYDIYQLIGLVRGPDKKTVKLLDALIKRIGGTPPPDVRSLNSVILSGTAPDFDAVIKRITGWLHENA